MNSFNDSGRMEHAGFDRIRADVGKAEGDLLRNKFLRHRVDAEDAKRVLCGECGDGCHAIAAECLHGFEVALNARPAAGVAPGDDEDSALW